MTGIGEAIAYALSSSGVRLVINGRTESKLRKVASNIEKKGGSVEVVVGDAGTEETAKRLVDTAIEKYGQLDIAVNNSARAHISKIYELTSEKIDEMVSTNIKGIIYGMKYQLPAIGKYSTKESPGNIINISSTLSTLVSPKASIGWSVYSASKSFVDTLTKIGALEAQSFNVRVNIINPGYVYHITLALAAFH
jgi:NAD(P)-dependent dehydrogenase (short-subunit alcohol dehydrogenase family)